MAIPLIIGIGIAAAGLYKGGKAIVDNNEANSLNDDANEIVEKAQKKLENSPLLYKILSPHSTKLKMWISSMMAIWVI